MRLVSILVLLSAAGAAPAQVPPPAADPAKVAFEWGLSIPLRDGVKLAATKYAPRGQKEPLPCVFTLTPYIAQGYHDRGLYFGANGYVFLTVDARGRGNSEGEFTPLLQEAHDAHDVVEWLATQPYCNGRTSMWGGSYAGYNQWAAAKEFPPHLTAIFPVASPYAGVDFPMQANMFYPYDMQWLTLVSGRASQSAIMGDNAFWNAAYERVYREHKPFATLDEELGVRSPIFRQWLAHPTVDAYWDAYNPTQEEFAKIDLPILSLTGHYDGDQPGALEFYRRHMRFGTPSAKAKHWLVIGPWDHPGTRTPRAEVGGLKFGEASLVDLNQLHKAWYDHTLKGGPRPAFLKAPVAYYVTGAEKWRYAETLEAVTAESRAFYLDSHEGRANDVYASGSLVAEPSKEPGIDRWVYDPLDTGNAAFKADASTPYLTDQSAIVQNRGRSLVYHTPPFPKATEVSGFFRLDAWLEIDQPDTDFEAAVYEIRPDGSSVFLSAARMRARYRESPREAKLVVPGAVLAYRFDGFTFVSRELAQGSRLRLVVGPVDSIYAQKNYNSGGVVAQESRADARTVTVKLHHGGERASALFVPLAPPP